MTTCLQIAQCHITNFGADQLYNPRPHASRQVKPMFQLSKQLITLSPQAGQPCVPAV